MKSKILVAASLATVITCAVSHAAALTWDGVGGSTWNTDTTGNWTGSAWAAGDDATFSSTGVGAVTVDTGVSVHNLTFNTAGYTLTGAQLAITGALAVNADTTLATNLPTGGGNTTITNAQLTMAPGSSIYYASDWWLDSPSVVTVGMGGTLTLPAWGYGSPGLGYLRPGSDHLVIDGGTVELKFAFAEWNSRGLSVGANGATLKNSITGSGWAVMDSGGGWGLEIANNSSLTLAGDGTGFSRINMNITGTGALIKTGTSRWELNGTNTYTGPTTVNGGMLGVVTATGMGPSTVLTLGTAVGTQVFFSGTNTSYSVASLAGGAITNPDDGYGHPVSSGNINFWNTGNSLTITGNASTTFGGTFNDYGNVVKTGTGTLTLTGWNNLKGRYVLSGGVLDGTAGSLFNWWWASDGTNAGVDILTGGKLRVDNWQTSNLGLGALYNDSASRIVIDGGALEITQPSSGYRPFTIGANGATLIYSGATNSFFNSGAIPITNNSSLTLGGAGAGTCYMNMSIGGTGTLTKTGTGMWAVDAPNTYSGPTVINEGVLALVHMTSTLGDGTTPVTLANVAGAALALNAGNWGAVGISIGSLAGGGALGGNVLLHGDTLTVGSLNTTTTFSGIITNSDWGSGNLTKVGTGTLTLAGLNSYFGNTVVSGGVLDIASTGQLYASGSWSNGVNINPGATLRLHGGWSIGTGGFSANLSTNATSLVIDGGTIDMAANYWDTGRSFTIGAGGATLKVEAGATWALNNDRFWQNYAGGAITVTNNSSLTLDGAGTGQMNIGLTGTGTLTKIGGGTWSLSGTNTYTGATTVSAGTLVVSNPDLSDTATLSIASGAVLNLPYTGTDTVGALVIHGVSQPNGLYDSTHSSGAITGTGKIQVGSSGMTAGYLAWAATFTGFTDNYPTHDPDGDGVTNQQEYAFGLDPTSGASANPIKVPLNKTTGTFSYTRLDPAVGGLSYVVYTSTDLNTWTVDAGATQTVTATGYDVQTVEVTLSGTKPLTAPELFVRVAAE